MRERTYDDLVGHGAALLDNPHLRPVAGWWGNWYVVSDGVTWAAFRCQR